MPDQHLRTEGDYEIWASDGIEYRRYSKENVLGKPYRALADRHPKAYHKLRESLDRRGKANGKQLSGLAPMAALNEIKREIQTERKLEAQRQAEQAMMHAAAASSPGDARVPAEAWGLLAGNLTERALLEENTGHAVSAVGMLGKMTGYLTEERGSQTHIERMQVIVLDQDTAELLTQRGGLLLDVVEGEFREPTETGEDDG